VKALGLLVCLAACAQTERGSGVAVRTDGQQVLVEGNRAMRALVVELEWDGEVTALVPGPDAARLTIFETDWEPGTRHAKVLVSDGRGVKLPARGAVIEAQGTGALRILSAEAAEDGPRAVDVEVKP